MFDAATALVVIDVQHGMFNGERCPPIHGAATLIAAIGALQVVLIT